MNWLNRLFEKFFRLFPQIFLVDPDEAGVRVTPKPVKGVWVQDLVPGWWLVWPILQNAEKIKIKTQVIDLRPQSIWTSDRHETVISGCIKYRVDSARKAILDVFDYDANIRTLALGIIFDFVTIRTLTDLKQDLESLKDEILKGLREASRGWGLKVEAIYLTDIGKVRNLRVLTNESLITIRAEENGDGGLT